MFVLAAFAALLAVTTAIPAPDVAVKIDPTLSWRVVGGDDAEDGAFPFIISLRTSSGSHRCGGSIISENYVVTAAHCVDGWNPASLYIVAGSNQLNSGGTRYSLSEIVVHEGWDDDLILNDIALLKTSEPIDLGAAKVEAVNLPSADPEDGSDVVLAGWGTLQNGGSVPNNLQYLNLRTVSYEQCEQRVWPNPLFRSQVCAFTANGQGACHGDSGGPLVGTDNVLVGIVSWGIPCGRGYPDVYTRVYSFLDWVKENTQ